MNINVRINKIYNDKADLNEASNCCIAVASAAIADTVVISGIRIVNGKNGLFISMPSRRMIDGTYVEICYPINLELRKELSAAVLSAYEKAVNTISEEEHNA